MGDSRWALRIHAACDWIMWAAAVNALWLAGTLAGGVVLGVGPATVAAAETTRRRLRGDRVHAVRDFGRAWAREFGGSQVTVGLPTLAAALIALHAWQRLATGVDAWGIAFAVAAAHATAVANVSAAMHAHYELPRRSHVATASLWVLRNPGPALLLSAGAVAVAASTALLPALVLFLSAGAWSTLSTALCLGFFAANDAALIPTNEGIPS